MSDDLTDKEPGEDFDFTDAVFGDFIEDVIGDFIDGGV